MENYKTLLILIALLSGISYTVFQQQQNQETPLNNLQASAQCAKDVVQQCRSAAYHYKQRLQSQNLFKISGYCAQSVSNKDCIQKLRDVRSSASVMVDYISRGRYHSSQMVANQMQGRCSLVDQVC